MHIRSTAAATAVLLTASVTGLAAATSAADAHVPHPHAVRSAPVLTVNISLTADGVTLDQSTVTPGNTMFTLSRDGGKGSIEVLRLKSGYGIKKALQDFQKIFGKGNVPYVKKVDKNVVFYGGAESAKGVTQQFGMKLDATGTYYVVNVDDGSLTKLKVAGATEARSLPKPDAKINWTKGNHFGDPKPGTPPTAGWLKQTNYAAEPHFTELQKVKGSTTRKQVQKFFDSGAQGKPSFVLPDRAGTLIVSPGHSETWYYDLSKGKYLDACFWPSKMNGAPHAFMGMWNLFHLG